ncbi:unnamed protein product [Alternaria alternata]
MYHHTSFRSLPNVLSHTTLNPACGFEGNNDIYGIGIRIGIYAQILAVWFANYFLLSEVQVLRDSISIFSVAILIVALIFASNPSDVYAVEAFVLLQILAWSCMMGVRAKSSYSKATFSRGSLLRRVVCEIVNLMNILEFLRLWTAWKVREKGRKFADAIRMWEESQRRSADEETIEEKGATEGEDHLARRTSEWEYSPRIASQETSKRSSRITVQEISSPPSPTSASSSHAGVNFLEDSPDLSIIHEVYESELYIQHCITASPYQMSTDGKPLTFPVIARSILFPKRYLTPAGAKPSPPSWFHCQLHSYIAFLTCRSPPQAFVIYSHLRQSRLLDPLNGPSQTYAALTYSAASPKPKHLPSWTSVSLASSLLLTGSSTPKKIWLGWYYVILDLLIHVIVILQLELTLRWNHVSGLSGLWNSVGQLIPFIIGVGGLGLVISRWLVKMWVKRVVARGEKSGWEVHVEENESDDEDQDEYERTGVSQGYERWKKAYLAQHANRNGWLVIRMPYDTAPSPSLDFELRLHGGVTSFSFRMADKGDPQCLLRHSKADFMICHTACDLYE